MMKSLTVRVDFVAPACAAAAGAAGLAARRLPAARGTPVSIYSGVCSPFSCQLMRMRLRYAQGLSERQIAASLGLGKGTVGAYLTRARVAGLTWPLPEALCDDDLELLLFPAAPSVPNTSLHTNLCNKYLRINPAPDACSPPSPNPRPSPCKLLACCANAA